MISGSLTFDDDPIVVDIDYFTPRARDKRVEANEELERTKDEAAKEAEIRLNEMKFEQEHEAFHTDVHRNELGEKISKEEYDEMIRKAALDGTVDTAEVTTSEDGFNIEGDVIKEFQGNAKETEEQKESEWENEPMEISITEDSAGDDSLLDLNMGDVTLSNAMDMFNIAGDDIEDLN